MINLSYTQNYHVFVLIFELFWVLLVYTHKDLTTKIEFQLAFQTQISSTLWVENSLLLKRKRHRAQ